MGMELVEPTVHAFFECSDLTEQRRVACSHFLAQGRVALANVAARGRLVQVLIEHVVGSVGHFSIVCMAGTGADLSASRAVDDWSWQFFR